MKKFSMFLALGLVVFGTGLALKAADSHADAAPCNRTKFDTKLTEDACKKGGQEEAKKAWKAWVTEAKAKDATMACKTCHSNMAPKFELTPDGLKKYKDLGGK